MKKQKIPEVRGRTLKKSERITEVTFLAPSIIGVLVFFILPFFVVVYYSVIDNPINRDFVFLENFKEILQNEAFQLASKNSSASQALFYFCYL